MKAEAQANGESESDYQTSVHFGFREELKQALRASYLRHCA